jgi:hypothetical protein
MNISHKITFKLFGLLRRVRPKLKDMFEILEALFNLEAVVVDPHHFGATTTEVVGQNIPRLIILAVMSATDNPEG